MAEAKVRAWEDWERISAFVMCPSCGGRINAEILPKPMADVTCPNCGITKLAVSYGVWKESNDDDR